MLSVIAVTVLAATPVLRLADLLEEAREHSPELTVATSRAVGASASARAAGALEDPRFLLQLWNAPVDFSNAPVMLQLSQSFPLGSRLKYRQKAAEAGAQAAQAEAAVRLRDVELEVERVYFELYRAQQTARVNVGLRETMAALEAAGAARLRSGTGQQADVFKAQAAVLEVQEEVELAGQEEAIARARLGALLNRGSGLDGDTTVPRVLADLPSEVALRARALELRPELKQLSFMSQAATAQLRMAEAERVPDLNVLAAYMHTFGGVSPSNFIFAGLEFTLPVWGSKNDGRIGAARSGAEAIAASQESTRARVDAEVTVAYAQVTAEARVVELHHRIIPLMRAALESGQAAFGAGHGDFLSALDTVRELRRHQLELIMHLAAYARALADLQRAVGADLGLLAAAEGGTDDAHR